MKENNMFGMKAIVTEDGLCHFEDGSIFDLNQEIEVTEENKDKQCPPLTP